jgi:uncharacterized protein DUF4384
MTRCLLALAAGALVTTGCCQTQMTYKTGSPKGYTVDWQAPGSAFKAGDRLCLEIASPTDCYVYVLKKEGADLYSVLVPNPALGQVKNRVKAGTALVLPPKAVGVTAAAPGFALGAGPQELVIVASQTPVASLQKLHKAADRSVASVDKILKGLVGEQGGGAAVLDKKRGTVTVTLAGVTCAPIVHRQTIRIAAK